MLDEDKKLSTITRCLYNFYTKIIINCTESSTQRYRSTLQPIYRDTRPTKLESTTNLSIYWVAAIGCLNTQLAIFMLTEIQTGRGKIAVC